MQEHINEFALPIPPLTIDEINLTFLKSLGDDWQIFQQSIGPRLHGISPSQLFDEILAFNSKTRRSIPATKDPLALSSRFQKHQSKHQSCHNSKPYDHPDIHCHYCKGKGHVLQEYLKKKWRDIRANEDDDRNMFRKEHKNGRCTKDF